MLRRHPGYQYLRIGSKICKEDFYKEDYRETTLKLISESLEYEILKKHYKELVEKYLPDEFLTLKDAN